MVNGQFWIVLLSLFFVTLFIVACGSGEGVDARDQETPTVHPYFASDTAALTKTSTAVTNEAIPPTISSLFSFVPSRTPAPLPTARPTSTAMVTPQPTATPALEAAGAETAVSPTAISALPEDGRFQENMIFDDDLNPNWSLEESWGVSYDLDQSDVFYSGEKAAVITPAEEFGAIFFTVKEDTREEYLYQDILGVSLWLNSGDTYLPLDEMAITILGSNASPYWDENDDSVDLVEGESFFSETRLYYLGLNEDLPPNQWVEVIIWLDQLPYDPDYTYITGIYVKNGDRFTETYYIDRVAFLLEGG